MSHILSVNMLPKVTEEIIFLENVRQVIAMNLHTSVSSSSAPRKETSLNQAAGLNMSFKSVRRSHLFSLDVSKRV